MDDTLTHSDEARYAQLQEVQHHAWEVACRRCGACCGVVEGDPCEHLSVGSDSLFLCAIYENRFGIHNTKSGRKIRCVPLRNILHESWPGDQECIYKKHFLRLRAENHERKLVDQ